MATDRRPPLDPHARPSSSYRSILVAIVVVTAAAGVALALLPYDAPGDAREPTRCSAPIALAVDDPAACDGDLLRLAGAGGFGLGAVAVGLLARRMRPPSPYDLLDGPLPPSDEALRNEHPERPRDENGL
jgi:hypothetical protein